MSETVTVPGAGKVKATYVYVGLAGAAAFVAFAYYRRSQGGSTEAPNLYADTRTGSELPDDGYTNPAPGRGTDATDPDAWKAPTTDQEWARQVIDRLSWYEPGFTSSVTGKYLAKQALTPDEQTLIREAWAQVGRPPGGQAIVPVAATPTATPVPAQPSAASMTRPTGLRAVRTDVFGVSLDWNHAPGAVGWRVYVNGKQNGPAVLYSQAYAGGLKKNTSYTIAVAGIWPGSKEGPRASISIKTKK